MARNASAMGAAILLALCVIAAPVRADEDGEDEDFHGAVELVVRDVSLSGSPQKYDEDFDGLDSGVRLGLLRLEWREIESRLIDHVRLESEGLGGDPYKSTSVGLGREGEYEARASLRSQAYLYDLFEVVDDLDASSWNAERRLADVDVTFHVSETVDLFFEFGQVERTGTSFFLKDVDTELYRMKTPLDQEVRHYSLGGRFAFGKVDVVFRQTIRDYDYRFENTTENDLGLLPGNFGSLDTYRWSQKDDGDRDLTTVTVRAPLGERVHLTASVFGNLLGTEEVESAVSLNAEGTSFRGACFVTGDLCTGTIPCDTSIPGNFCVPESYEVVDGMSRASMEADTLLIDADLSVRLLDRLDFHLQGRSVDREIDSVHTRDLDGNGVADDLEGTVLDTTPGSTTRIDYAIDTWTGLFDWRPNDLYRLRLGYRTISRELERSGFEFGTNEYANTPFESGSDDTLILGAVVSPLDWLRLDADYEEGDVAQAFTAAAPMETDRFRLRARIEASSRLRLDLGYLSYENSNDGTDFRTASNCSDPAATIEDGCWASRAEATTLSASLWHGPTEAIDYWVRWARHDVDSVVRVRFDTDLFFNSAENGDSVYENDYDEWSGRINVRWAENWKGFARFQFNQSDGRDRVAGTTFSFDRPLAQDWADVEVGLDHAFANGLYVGGRLRQFDYDDADDRLDYDGDIVSAVVGFTF